MSSPHLWERSACAIALSAAFICAPHLVLAQAPPQATPGAVQPQPPALPPAAPPGAPSLSIPRMLDRPLGLQEGPRVRVGRFRLTGATDHRRLGLYVSELQRWLGDALQKQPAVGYTINELQQLATQLTDYYHHRGLILAQVILPAQEVQGGVVELRVLEGKLEAVKVEGNKHNRTSALQAPFGPLVGQSIEQDRIDAALLRLIDYPGLVVQGVVTPGTAVDTSDLLLRVTRENLFDFDQSLDNFGNKLSGEDRYTAGVHWNSPLGLGDRLYVYGLQTFTIHDGSEHTTYGGVDYRIPFFAALSALDVSYSLNDYAVGQQLGITGKVRDAEGSYHQELFRNRTTLLYADAIFADKHADLSFPAGLPRGQEYLADAGADMGLRYSDDWHGFSDVGLGYVHGWLASPSAGDQRARTGADPTYNIVNYHFQRQQQISRYQTLVVTVGGQWTDEALPTLEELALGGPANVRGFDVAAYVADEGEYGSIEYLIGAPGFASRPAFGGKTWGDLLQFSVFGDIGHGSTNKGLNPQPSLPSETMRDVGAALQFNLPNRVYARVSWARRLAPSIYFTQFDSKEDYIYGSIGIHL